MRIQQLRELLTLVIQCRLNMAKLYGRLDTNADSSRVKMILEYFKQNQEHLAESMQNYIDDAPARILDTWYTDITFEDFKKRCEQTSLPANMTSEDVLALHLDLDNRVLALLDKTAETSVVEEISSALKELVRVDRIHQQRLVHSTLRMEDI